MNNTSPYPSNGIALPSSIPGLTDGLVLSDSSLLARSITADRILRPSSLPQQIANTITDNDRRISDCTNAIDAMKKEVERLKADQERLHKLFDNMSEMESYKDECAAVISNRLTNP